MVANNPTCNFKDNEVEEVINIVDRRQLWVTAISIVKAMDTSLWSDNYLRDSSIMINIIMETQNNQKMQALFKWEVPDKFKLKEYLTIISKVKKA